MADLLRTAGRFQSEQAADFTGIRNRQMDNLGFYAMYYSLFNAFSANIMQLPYLSLNSVVRISHKKVFSEIDNYLVRNKIYDGTFLELLNQLRLMREAYSYNLPLGSRFDKDRELLSVNKSFESISNKLPVIFQVSNLLSYLTYYAWNKKVGDIPDEYDKYQIECDEMFFSFIELRDHLGKHCLIDEDDYHRQGYLLRQARTPIQIDWFILEKMVEDLESGWDKEGRNSGDIFDINEVSKYLSAIL